MRFAADEWLWGVLFSLVLAGILILQGWRLSRDRNQFAREERIAELLTARTGLRRTIAAVLSCLAIAFAFVAAAQPQYGKGTRILPATNLDVVIVLDYSKSMYARDVSPSRIGRAKVEVGRMIRQLGGARFAAVAFAGDSISFPLTSDGSAIAQFFRGMEPNHLPVGGTAIARALETGRQLLDRDPLSRNHERVMILVTDGEDLEGDPVQVAQDARTSGIRVEVVQIGGQSPEPIPNIDENGVQRGLRKDTSGQMMTTQLTPEGEAQLASIAQAGGGHLVRAATGKTGIGEMTKDLRTLMSEELSERVETVFAEVYYYPLALAVFLLLIETFVGAAPKRVVRREPPKGRRRQRKPRRLQASAALLALCTMGCAEFDSLFERESPVVNEAIRLLEEEKDPEQATQTLIEYLETGPCEEGVIGAGDRARQRPDASFDLGLSFAGLARAETGNAPTTPTSPLNPNAPADPEPPSPDDPPSPSINCAVRILATVSGDPNNSAAVRARAFYVAGNLELLREDFQAAVAAYDQAILLAPAVSGDNEEKEPFASLKSDQPLGRHIAYNRALALRLQQEKEQQEQENQSNQDQSEDQQNEESDDQEKSDESDQQEEEESESDEDSEKQEEQEQSEESDPEQEQDEQQNEEGEEQEEEQQSSSSDQQESDEESSDEKNSDEPTSPPPSEAQEKSPSEARDQRMLDLLEQAPTLQQHNAEQQKNRGVRVRSTMEDK